MPSSAILLLYVEIGLRWLPILILRVTGKKLCLSRSALKIRGQLRDLRVRETRGI